MPNAVDLEEQSYAIPRSIIRYGDAAPSDPRTEPWHSSVERYYSDVSAVYDHLYHDKLSLQENDYIAKRLRDAGNRVLDLGCGTGLGLTLLPHDDISYLGIDFCPRTAEYIALPPGFLSLGGLCAMLDYPCLGIPAMESHRCPTISRHWRGPYPERTGTHTAACAL